MTPVNFTHTKKMVLQIDTFVFCFAIFPISNSGRELNKSKAVITAMIYYMLLYIIRR